MGEAMMSWTAQTGQAGSSYERPRVMVDAKHVIGIDQLGWAAIIDGLDETHDRLLIFGEVLGAGDISASVPLDIIKIVKNAQDHEIFTVAREALLDLIWAES